MITTERAKTGLKILCIILVAVLSIFVFAPKIPETQVINDTLQFIEDSSNTVMSFTGATMTASLALSALPDDFATPLANTLSDMNMYFVLILVVLFVERLIVVEGIRIAFMIVIPVVCGMEIAAIIFRLDAVRNFACRLAVLALAIIIAIPGSTMFVNAVCSDYLDYVDSTISETTAGADKINSVVAESDDDSSLLDKLSDALKNALDSVNDLLDYFKNIVKKCVNSIAILIVTTVVMPLLTMFFFRWLLNELFRITLPEMKLKSLRSVDKSDKNGGNNKNGGALIEAGRK